MSYGRKQKVASGRTQKDDMNDEVENCIREETASCNLEDAHEDSLYCKQKPEAASAMKQEAVLTNYKIK